MGGPDSGAESSGLAAPEHPGTGSSPRMGRDQSTDSEDATPGPLILRGEPSGTRGHVFREVE